jgi:hypothetical protein
MKSSLTRISAPTGTSLGASTSTSAMVRVSAVLFLVPLTLRFSTESTAPRRVLHAGWRKKLLTSSSLPKKPLEKIVWGQKRKPFGKGSSVHRCTRTPCFRTLTKTTTYGQGGELGRGRMFPWNTSEYSLAPASFDLRSGATTATTKEEEKVQNDSSQQSPGGGGPRGRGRDDDDGGDGGGGRGRRKAKTQKTCSVRRCGNDVPDRCTNQIAMVGPALFTTTLFYLQPKHIDDGRCDSQSVHVTKRVTPGSECNHSRAYGQAHRLMR